MNRRLDPLLFGGGGGILDLSGCKVGLSPWLPQPCHQRLHPRTRPSLTCPCEGPNHAHLRAGWIRIGLLLDFPWAACIPQTATQLLGPSPRSWLLLWGPSWELPAQHRLLPWPCRLGLLPRDKPSFPAASLSVPGCPDRGHVPALGTAKLSWGRGSSPDPRQCLPVSGHFRPCTARHSPVGSDLKLGVEVEEVGCCIGCGRWHVPCRRGWAKSVAKGTVEGCRGEVHQTGGHGGGRCSG